MALALLLAFCLSSCVIYRHEATSASGNKEIDTIASLGGASSQKGADGSSFVHDHQTSFRDFATAITSLAGAYIAGNVQKAAEITAQLKAKGATDAQIAGIQAAAAQQAATTAARAKVTGQAIGAGAPVNPITVTPP